MEDKYFDDFNEWLTNQQRQRRYSGGTLPYMSAADSSKLNQQISYDTWRQWLDEYNYDKFESPAARMAALKDAGINENIAAQGIAGAAGQSTGIDAPSPGQLGAASPSDLERFASMFATMMSGVQAGTTATSAAAKLPGELKILDNQSVKLLHEIGIDDWTIRSMEVEFPYLERKTQADLYLKIAQVNETNQRWQNLVKEHDNIVASYQKIISETAENWSQVGENVASADKMVAEKGLIDENKRWRKIQTDFWQEEGYDLNNPAYVALQNCLVNGKLDNAQKIGQAIYDSFNAEGRGTYDADPYNAQVRELFKSRDELQGMESEFVSAIQQLEGLYSDGKIEPKAYSAEHDRLSTALKQLKSDLKEMNKLISKYSYSQGHHSYYQDLLNGVVNFGVVLTGKKK